MKHTLLKVTPFIEVEKLSFTKTVAAEPTTEKVTVMYGEMLLGELTEQQVQQLKAILVPPVDKSSL
ncbi:hypothetical protein [Pontibacter rugosus]|uniref:Uncharacterized protein n=1 Tax=Pontibacter rugosus TaxID=1745966 RepID=A0ABW3SMY3_9BACT